MGGRLAALARRARWRHRRDRDQHGRGLARNRGCAWSPSSAAPPASTATTAPTTAPRTVALLVGGALKGGRVIADWPGLKDADLYEKRDLKATTDLRAVLKGLLKDHLRLDEQVLATKIFPGSADVKPMTNLFG